MIMFVAKVSQQRSGGWSTQLICSATLQPDSFSFFPSSAGMEKRSLGSKTALGKLRDKQLGYLCKASGAGGFCMHGRISLPLDSLRDLKQPLKCDTWHPTDKEG